MHSVKKLVQEVKCIAHLKLKILTLNVFENKKKCYFRRIDYVQIASIIMFFMGQASSYNGQHKCQGKLCYIMNRISRSETTFLIYTILK